MIDISAVGAFVRIAFKGDGKKRGWAITEFSDEGTPFECPDVDLSTNQKNLNGQMISSRTPSVYTVSVTVIPNSKDDVFLTRHAQEAALQPGNIVPIDKLIVESIELGIPDINGSRASTLASRGTSFGATGAGYMVFKWMNGRMKNAPTGPSTSAEGRLASRTFTFEMEKFIAPTGNGSNVDSSRG